MAGALILIVARKKHKADFTAEAQRTRRLRREGERQGDKKTRKQGELILVPPSPILPPSHSSFSSALPLRSLRLCGESVFHSATIGATLSLHYIFGDSSNCHS